MFLKDLFKKKLFMEWEDYLKRIRFIENYVFQQRVRRENVKNLEIS